MTPVVNSIKENDRRKFIIKYWVGNGDTFSLKKIETIPNLKSYAGHSKSSNRKHFGFLRVSSCLQSIRVYS